MKQTKWWLRWWSGCYDKAFVRHSLDKWGTTINKMCLKFCSNWWRKWSILEYRTRQGDVLYTTHTAPWLLCYFHVLTGTPSVHHTQPWPISSILCKYALTKLAPPLSIWTTNKAPTYTCITIIKFFNCDVKHPTWYNIICTCSLVLGLWSLQSRLGYLVSEHCLIRERWHWCWLQKELREQLLLSSWMDDHILYTEVLYCHYYVHNPGTLKNLSLSTSRPVMFNACTHFRF